MGRTKGLTVESWPIQATVFLEGPLVFRKLFSLVIGTAVLAGVIITTQASMASAAPATCPTGNAAIASYSYVFKSVDGTVRTANTLRNNTRPGDEVTVTFRISNNCSNVQVSLATYRAPEIVFIPSTAAQQELYSSATGFFSTGTHTLKVNVPTPPGTPGPNCPNSFTAPENGGGANTSGPYDTTCDGAPSLNGAGDGNAEGKPCAGCVGNADNKNPQGQLPNAKNDGNNGYECDDNNGVGKSNPAHSGCTSNHFFQIDFVRGPVLATLGPAGSNNFYGVQGRLIDYGHG